MYVPKLYREEDRQEILDFLRKNNFPALVTNNGERPIATHLAVEIVENEQGDLTICGHMSRANPQWKTFDDREALMIFQGPHTYISPTWYNHINVPTWNYQNIHVYGKLRILEGDDAYKILSRLVMKHESHSQYRLENLPEDFVQKEIKGIVAFALDVIRIDAGFKLSQNRNDEDHQNIINELHKRPDETSHQVATAMKKQRTA